MDLGSTASIWRRHGLEMQNRMSEVRINSLTLSGDNCKNLNLSQTSDPLYLSRNNGNGPTTSRMIHREMSIDIIDDSYSSSIAMADSENESQVRVFYVN